MISPNFSFDQEAPHSGHSLSNWSTEPLKRVLKSHNSGMSPIKNTASTDRVEGFVFAFSASGQDVYLPEAMFHGPGIVLSAVGARCGKTFKADGEWAVTANTHVFFVADGNYRDYWWYVTNNEGWWERDGAAQPFVRVKATLDRFWLVPPYEEQVAIAEFLDIAELMLRGGVSQKLELVELMEEYKRAVIQQAVTRGLDPDVHLKPSGVEWLGDIPEHWEVCRLKTCVSNVIDKETGYDRGICLALEHVEGWTGKYWDAGADFVLDSDMKCFQPNDVLFGKLRPYLAKVARPDSHGICVGEFLVLRPLNDLVSPEFLEYLLRSQHTIDAVNASTFGARMPRADWQFIGDMPHAFPPPAEQAAIVAHLDKLTSDIDAAIAHTRREIELLEEYRTRLIADVVTGKLDVREAAVNLPDVSPDDLQPLAEGDEAED